MIRVARVVKSLQSVGEVAHSNISDFEFGLPVFVKVEVLECEVKWILIRRLIEVKGIKCELVELIGNECKGTRAAQTNLIYTRTTLWRLQPGLDTLIILALLPMDSRLYRLRDLFIKVIVHTKVSRICGVSSIELHSRSRGVSYF